MTTNKSIAGSAGLAKEGLITPCVAPGPVTKPFFDEDAFAGAVLSSSGYREVRRDPATFASSAGSSSLPRSCSSLVREIKVNDPARRPAKPRGESTPNGGANAEHSATTAMSPSPPPLLSSSSRNEAPAEGSSARATTRIAFTAHLISAAMNAAARPVVVNVTPENAARAAAVAEAEARRAETLRLRRLAEEQQRKEDEARREREAQERARREEMEREEAYVLCPSPSVFRENTPRRGSTLSSRFVSQETKGSSGLGLNHSHRLHARRAPRRVRARGNRRTRKALLEEAARQMESMTSESFSLLPESFESPRVEEEAVVVCESPTVEEELPPSLHKQVAPAGGVYTELEASLSLRLPETLACPDTQSTLSMAPTDTHPSSPLLTSVVSNAEKVPVPPLALGLVKDTTLASEPEGKNASPSASSLPTEEVEPAPAPEKGTQEPREKPTDPPPPPTVAGGKRKKRRPEVVMAWPPSAVVRSLAGLPELTPVTSTAQKGKTPPFTNEARVSSKLPSSMNATNGPAAQGGSRSGTASSRSVQTPGRSTGVAASTHGNTEHLKQRVAAFSSPLKGTTAPASAETSPAHPTTNHSSVAQPTTTTAATTGLAVSSHPVPATAGSSTPGRSTVRQTSSAAVPTTGASTLPKSSSQPSLPVPQWTHGSSASSATAPAQKATPRAASSAFPSRPLNVPPPLLYELRTPVGSAVPSGSSSSAGPSKAGGVGGGSPSTLGAGGSGSPLGGGSTGVVTLGEEPDVERAMDCTRYGNVVSLIEAITPRVYCASWDLEVPLQGVWSAEEEAEAKMAAAGLKESQMVAGNSPSRVPPAGAASAAAYGSSEMLPPNELTPADSPTVQLWDAGIDARPELVAEHPLPNLHETGASDPALFHCSGAPFDSLVGAAPNHASGHHWAEQSPIAFHEWYAVRSVMDDVVTPPLPPGASCGGHSSGTASAAASHSASLSKRSEEADGGSSPKGISGLPGESSCGGFQWFEGPGFREPVVLLHSIWNWMNFPFGCTVPLSHPVALSRLREKEESLVYHPQLSGFRLRFIKGSSSYAYLKSLKYKQAEIAKEQSGGREGPGNEIETVEDEADEVGLLRWSASERPDNRNLLTIQIDELVKSDPRFSLLLSGTTVELDHRSWVSVLWQPVFCGGHTAKESTGSFLAFYLLRPPYHLFQPFAASSASAKRNASCESPTFRADRAVVGFDLWDYEKDFRLGRPSLRRGLEPGVWGGGDGGLARESAGGALPGGGGGGGGGDHTSATTATAAGFIAERVVRVPLVGLISYRARTDVWHMPAWLPLTPPSPSSLSPQRGGAAGGGTGALVDPHAAYATMNQPMGSSAPSNNAGGGVLTGNYNVGSGVRYYRAPLFLVAAALQLMVWGAFEEMAREERRALKYGKLEATLAPALPSDPAAGAVTASFAPSANSSSSPPMVDANRTEGGLPWSSEGAAQHGVFSVSGSTTAAGAAPATTGGTYFARGVAALQYAASRYRHLREAAKLDFPLPSSGLPAGEDGGATRCPVVAGGTFPELFESPETRIIAGLLDFYQWVQYDAQILDFVSRYSR